LSQKEPISEPTADQVGVLADEPDPGALGQVAFEQRPGVDIPQRTGRLLQPAHEFRERLQPVANHIVVVLEPGIGCNDSLVLTVWERAWGSPSVRTVMARKRSCG